MANHKVPSRENYEPGFFRSDATIIVRGAENGSPGYSLGGWDDTVEARIYTGGPNERGPHVYAIGNCLVLDRRGGTSADNARARAEGRLFEVEPGDTIEVAGIIVEVSLCPRRYPVLTIKGQV